MSKKQANNDPSCQIQLQSHDHQDLVRSLERLNNKAKKVSKDLKRMIFSSYMMRNLMQDLLDLAQLENSTFRINNQFFDLTQVITKAFSIVRHFSDDKNMKLVSKIDQSVLHFFANIYGDERRYTQILINFVSNAIKFSFKDSTIEVSLTVKEVQVKTDTANDQEQILFINFELVI